MFIRRIWLPVIALAVVSCGGGGSTPVHPATQYRANGPGDEWDYSVVIDFGKFGTYPGTLSIAISDDTYNGEPTIKATQVFTVDSNTGPDPVTSYSEQSQATGALLAETVNGSLLDVTSDTFSVPAQIGPNVSTSGSIGFSNGESIDFTYKVNGAQAVSTPSGQYSCWQVGETSKRSDGTSDAFTEWVAPETGNYVMLKDTTKNPDGSGYTYTAKLTSQTAPPILKGAAIRLQTAHLMDAVAAHFIHP